MKVNYVLMYGTPYLKYRKFETFEDISKFLVNKRIVNYSIFKKLEDKEEVEMIYRDNDIQYLEKELDKYKNVLDNIKEFCKHKIQEQKEMVDFSKYYLENYDKAISETNSSHSGILLETIKSTTIKRYEDILELLEEVE